MSHLRVTRSVATCNLQVPVPPNRRSRLIGSNSRVSICVLPLTPPPLQLKSDGGGPPLRVHLRCQWWLLLCAGDQAFSVKLMFWDSTLRPPKNSFPDTPRGRGLLFVAQHLREMLLPSSFESFRARALDTMARIKEAIDVVEAIRLSGIPRATLKPVIAELMWSFRDDPVASSIAADEVTAFRECEKRIDDVDLRQVRALLNLLISALGTSYRTALEGRIKDVYFLDRKNDLRLLVAYWCSHIINLGYSREYTLYKVNEHFFSHDILRVRSATIDYFFKEFSSGSRTFVTYAAVGTVFAKYLQDIGESVEKKASLSNVISSAVASNSEFAARDYIYSKRVDAFDDASAAAAVHQGLASFRAMTFLSPRGLDCQWSDEMYVRPQHAQSGRFVAPPGNHLQGSSGSISTSGHAQREIQRYSRMILGSFDGPSTERLLSSIGTSALARTTASAENQLISLWSAVEVLLSEPAVGTPRIVHYVELILPCVCLRYVRRQVTAIFEELIVSYRKKFSTIVSKEPLMATSDQYLKFAAILILPANQALRDELVNLCNDNPLALHRMYRVGKDYRTGADAKVAMEGNKNRVEWQLHRIYRARNNLVHAGMVPGYLDAIILNMFEYYRTSVATIIKAARGKERGDIDQAVYNIGVNFGANLRQVRALGQGSIDTPEALQLLVI